MTPSNWLALVLGTLLIHSAPSAPAADPAVKERFDAKFGPALQSASATRDTDDDLALAQDMIAAAKATDDPAFAALLGDQAQRLALPHPAGYEAAAEALSLLAQHDPARAIEALDQLTRLREKHSLKLRPDARAALNDSLIEEYGQLGELQARAELFDDAAATFRKARAAAARVKSPRADEFRDLIDFLTELRSISGRLRVLEDKLKTKPDDRAAATEWVQIQLADRDDPAAAGRYAQATGDPDLIRIVELTATPADQRLPADEVTLAEWYRRQADARRGANAAAALARARAGYLAYLASSPEPGLTLTRAKLALRTVEEAISKLPASALRVKSAPTPPRIARNPETTNPNPNPNPAPSPNPGESPLTQGGVDLLTAFDVARHSVRGEWLRVGTRLFIRPEQGDRITLPYTVSGDYQCLVDFEITDPMTGLAIVLPIRDRSVALLVNAFKGRYTALSTVDGVVAPEHGALHRQPAPLATYRRHGLRIRVGSPVKEPPAAGDDATTPTPAPAPAPKPDADTQIDVQLDGATVLTWRGQASSLASWPTLALKHPRALGLGWSGAETPAVIHAFTLTSPQGRLLKLRDQELADPAALTQGTLDLAARIDPAADAVAGAWTRADGNLACEPAPLALIRSPLPALGNYRIEVEIAQASPNATLVLQLPAGDTVAVVQAGTISRIHSLRPRQGSYSLKRSDSSPQRIEVWVAHRGVDQVEVTLRLDNKRAAKWIGAPRELSAVLPLTPRSGADDDKDRPLLGVLNGSVQIKAWRLIAGKAEDPDEPTAPITPKPEK